MAPNRGTTSVVCVLALVLAFVASGCSGGSSGTPGPPPGDAIFLVTDDRGVPIVGATVYLVPAGDVDTSDITATDVRNGTAQDRDEPVDDQVRLNGSSYPHATTGPDGKAHVVA